MSRVAYIEFALYCKGFPLTAITIKHPSACMLSSHMLLKPIPTAARASLTKFVCTALLPSLLLEGVK